MFSRGGALPQPHPLLIYLGTRALTFLLLTANGEVLIGLVYSRLHLLEYGPVQGLWEYPWPLSALLDVPLRMGASSGWGYAGTCLAVFLTIDAALVWLFWRAGERRLTPGLLLWLFVPVALGPIALAMPDLIPAAAAGASLVALSRARPALAGALLGIASALKLWPAAGVAALALPGSWRDRRAALLVLAAVGLAAVAATLAAGGLARIVSPFFWHGARGLQIEALPALPLLWLQHWDGGSTWVTSSTQFNCYEISGPGVDIALGAGQVATLLGLAAAGVLHWRAFAAPAEARTAALAGRLMLVTVLAVLAGSKVLSPQFLVWIAVPLAALGALPRSPSVGIECVLLLGACALTQWVFPFNYPELNGTQGRTSAWVLGALTLRDVLLLTIGVRLAVQCWRATARHGAQGAPLRIPA